MILFSCNTHMNLWVELDQEALSLEAQLANFGPIKGVYFCVALEEKTTQTGSKEKVKKGATESRTCDQFKQVEEQKNSPEKPGGPCEKRPG